MPGHLDSSACLPPAPDPPPPLPSPQPPSPTPCFPQPPCRLDHKNAILGWTYTKDDIELEPRFNLGTESLSAGVTWRVDDENKLRAVVDMGTNEGALTWTNCGSLGGGGETKLTARMRLDKDSMQQVGVAGCVGVGDGGLSPRRRACAGWISSCGMLFGWGLHTLTEPRRLPKPSLTSLFRLPSPPPHPPTPTCRCPPCC